MVMDKFYEIINQLNCLGLVLYEFSFFVTMNAPKKCHIMTRMMNEMHETK